MSEHSSSSKTVIKASTRTKGKHSSDAPQEYEKRELSETPEEKKKEKKEEETEKTRKLFESTVLFSVDEAEAVSSSVLSALKNVDDCDDADEKPKAAPKVKRAPFVVYEAKENIGTGSSLSNEAAYGSHSITARHASHIDSFQRKCDRDEQPSAGAIVAASTSTSAIDTRHQKLSRDEQQSGAPPRLLGLSSHPVLRQGGQSSSPGAVPAEGKATNVDLYRRKFDRDEQPSADAMVAGFASTLAIDTRRQKLSRDEQQSGAPLSALVSSSHLVPPQGGQLLSPVAVPVEGKATNVDVYRRKFDRDERPSAGDAMVAGSASASASASTATSEARIVTSVDARRSKFDRDEQPTVSASLSAIDTRRRNLNRDEQPSGATYVVLSSSLPAVLPQGGQFSSPGAVTVEGLGLITESDGTREFNTASPPSQRPPAQAHLGDTRGFLAEAVLVTEDPPIIAIAVPDPLPPPFWRESKFQWGGGLILCLVVVGVAVGGSDGSVDRDGPAMSPTLSSSPSLVPSMAPSSVVSLVPSSAPSTAPSFTFEVWLAQSLPTNSQDAQAFEWLQDDPALSTYTKLEVLQRYALATLYYTTDGENWINNTGWLDYSTAECDWFTAAITTDSCIDDGRYSQLILKSNGLSSVGLPEALVILTDLRTMNLLNNELMGQLPSTLGSLS
jgi:hypothetical protein